MLLVFCNLLLHLQSNFPDTDNINYNTQPHMTLLKAFQEQPT